MSDDLIAALAQAQAEFPAITKSHTNPHYKSRYADLADVLAAVRPVLAKHGIVLMQPIVTNDDGATFLLTCLRGHGGGLESRMALHLADMTPQQVGSTLTYFRRYTLASMLGVAAEDDDDGNAAQTAPPARWAQTQEVVDTFKAMKGGDPYALAAANPPEKPLAAMTAGEMARYGESIGVRVTGSKADILRTLTPYVKAATGEEPFDTTAGQDMAVLRGKLEEPEPQPFEPVVATFDDEMKMKTPDVRRSMTRRGD